LFDLFKYENHVASPSRLRWTEVHVPNSGLPTGY
jgi:hypothetical protein